MESKVVIVETGLANVASLCAAFKRLGVGTEVSSDAELIKTEPLVVLPGVGAFAAGMKVLTDKKLVAPLVERILQQRSTLAICLGLQLLCESSEESPGVDGLGVLPVAVKRFGQAVSVPQIGWNQVEVRGGSSILQSAAMYFANSYYLPPWSNEQCIAIAQHGVEFVAAVEFGSVLGCQFHPELSSRAGEELLSRWLVSAGGKDGSFEFGN